MELTKAIIDIKTYTSGDYICALTSEGPAAGEVESFDAHQRIYTLKTPEGKFVQLEEKSILAVIDSAPLSPLAQEAAPTVTPNIGARTFNFNNHLGGQTNLYDTSTNVHVNVGYGGTANLYFRSSTVNLPPPPLGFVKCTNQDAFYALWLAFYQNNFNYINYTGVPTNTTRPGVTIATSGPVQIINGNSITKNS